MDTALSFLSKEMGFKLLAPVIIAGSTAVAHSRVWSYSQGRIPTVASIIANRVLATVLAGGCTVATLSYFCDSSIPVNLTLSLLSSTLCWPLTNYFDKRLITSMAVSEGTTPLHIAARIGHSYVAEQLMQNGPAVNARDNLERTPLHIAAGNGHFYVAEQLIQHGAAVNARDNQEWTPLHRACINPNAAVAQLLLQNGADLNAACDTGLTPLTLAGSFALIEVVRILLDNRVNPNTVLEWNGGHLDTQARIIETLLKAGLNILELNLDEERFPQFKERIATAKANQRHKTAKAS